MISILDYGVGNLGSIVNMFRKIGVPVELADRPERVAHGGRLLLPGVGAFDSAMARFRAQGFDEALCQRAQEGVPVLGICLGMQMLGRASEEGDAEGLALVDGTCRRFDPAGLKVPHMGWNMIKTQKSSPLLRDLGDESRFYFVHSYYMECVDSTDVLATSQYGAEFVSMVSHGNIFGAQFHPEKSHRFGMTLLRNFAEL